MSGKKPYHGYIKDDIITVHMSMFLKKHSRMNKVLNTKIDQLIQSGIMQRLIEAQFAKSTDVTKKEKEDDKKDDVPEQLTMEHLELCFVTILICLAVSCVAFFYEVLIGLLSSM